MSKQYSISETYLNELLDYWSKSLVGKMMKRFEILEDKEMIKRDVKELVYEAGRSLRDLLEAHNVGLDVSQFQFHRKPPSRSI